MEVGWWMIIPNSNKIEDGPLAAAKAGRGPHDCCLQATAPVPLQWQCHPGVQVHLQKWPTGISAELARQVGLRV